MVLSDKPIDDQQKHNDTHVSLNKLDLQSHDSSNSDLVDSKFQGDITKQCIDDNDSTATDLKPSSKDSSDSVSVSSKQAGVELVELLRHAWPKKLLYMAYGSLVLSYFITNFSKYASGTYTPYVTSSFSSHSLLATAGVIERIASIVTYPIMAKCSDFFGRAEGFVIAFTIVSLSYVIMASCQNVQTYVAGGVFDAIGDVAYGIMVQIFITDTSSFVNRGLLLSLPEAVTSIPTLYLGSIVAHKMLEHSTWRWGYGMWAICLPVIAFPLVIIQFMLERKAKHAGVNRKEIRILKTITKDDSFFKKVYKVGWIELDLPGCILLLIGLSLILVPITLTGKAYSYRWKDASFIAMFVVGFVVTAGFVIWDAKIAKKPFIPYKTIRHWTVIAALCINILDFMSYGCFASFFPSFLQVAGHMNPDVATRTDNSMRVSFQISSVIIGLIMRYYRRSKIFVFIGVPLCVLGQGLMIYMTNAHGTAVSNQVCLITAKVLYGIGRGFYQTSLQVAVQRVVLPEETAIATAVFYATMSLGGSIGISIGGAFWNNYLPERLAELLPQQAQANATKIFKSIVVAKGTTGAVREAVDTAYRMTVQKMAIISFCCLVPMLVLMFAVANVKLQSEEEEMQVEALEKQDFEQRYQQMQVENNEKQIAADTQKRV